MAMSYDGSEGKAYFSSDFGKTWAANNAAYTGAQAYTLVMSSDGQYLARPGLAVKIEFKNQVCPKT